jgi:hypothetical protein
MTIKIRKKVKKKVYISPFFVYIKLMEPGQKVSIPYERLISTGAVYKMHSGNATLIHKVWENKDCQAWLIDFDDRRFALPVQYLFDNSNLPETTLIEEVIMATRKTVKKVAAKPVKESVAKEVSKTVKKKSSVKQDSQKPKAEKPTEVKPQRKFSSEKKPLSKFIAEMIVEAIDSDEKIASACAKEYPDYKGTSVGTVEYYRKRINDGKMVKSGFEIPKTPYVAVGGSSKVSPKVSPKKEADEAPVATRRRKK